MAVKRTPSVVSSTPFMDLKQVRFLRTVQRLRLNGQLLFTQPQRQPWIFHLHLGNIIYATGGIHPVRRWQRNLAVHCSEISTQSSALQRDLAGIDASSCWDYQLLCLWVTQQKIKRHQAANVIRSILVEVLFDLSQEMNVTNQVRQDRSLSEPLILIDVEEAIAETQSLWQAWQDAQLSEYSPNKAPIIKQPDQLRKRPSAEIYQNLANLLDGKQTLRDLAVLRQRDVVDVTRALLPYLQWGWVELINLPDLPAPTSIKASVPKTPLPIKPSTKPLVACVDDSHWVIHTMEKVIGAAGYQFIGVENPLRAIPTLLGRKPDLIFLDLVMPNVNGYEICTQLRKLSRFQTTPIVILTGKDGAADRIQAKFVGATDFLSKPLDARQLLNVLHKHLNQGVINH